MADGRKIDISPDLVRCSASVYIDRGFNLDFFKYLFPYDKASGKYLVTATNPVGEFLTHSARQTPVPAILQPRKGSEICELAIPTVNGLPRNQWLMYKDADITRINHILNAWFEIDFYRYYIKGIEYGYDKKDIIEAYVISRNLVTGEPFDTLHKRVYRRQMETMKRKSAILSRKARYFFDESDPTAPKPK